MLVRLDAMKRKSKFEYFESELRPFKTSCSFCGFPKGTYSWRCRKKITVIKRATMIEIDINPQSFVKIASAAYELE